MPTELADTLTATDDERLDQAEALVRGYCGWHISPSREATVTLRGPAASALLLPSMYVTEISSVTVDGALQTVDTDYYEFEGGYLIRPGGWWWWTAQQIVVEFVHGYPIPPAEVTAVVQAVAQRAVENPGSLVSEQIGPFSNTYSTTGSNQVSTLSLLDSEKEILRRYRIPAMA